MTRENSNIRNNSTIIKKVELICTPDLKPKYVEIIEVRQIRQDIDIFIDLNCRDYDITCGGDFHQRDRYDLFIFSAKDDFTVLDELRIQYHDPDMLMFSFIQKVKDQVHIRLVKVENLCKGKLIYQYRKGNNEISKTTP